MIEEIEFKNFKALERTTLPLGRLTLIVGTEGSGKSSAVQGLAAHCFQERWSYDEVKTRGLDVARGVTCFALWKEPGNELVGRLCWSNGSPKVGRRAGYYYTLSGSGDSSRFSRTLAETFILDPDAMAEEAWLKNCCPYLDRDGRNLARMLRLLEQHNPQRFQQLNREFRRWLPAYNGFSLEQPRHGYRAIAVRTRQDARIAAADVPPQVLLILGLLSLPYLAHVSMLVLDEPDLGLDSRQIALLRDYLCRLACRKTRPAQVILTTRNPQLPELFQTQSPTIVLAEKCENRVHFAARTKLPATRRGVD
jgi:predicted ATPase